MKNIDWGNLRLALYAIVGGIVSALGAMSIIAQEQVDSTTQVATSVLGAVLAIVAAANVHKKKKDESVVGTAYINVEPRLVAPVEDFGGALERKVSSELPVYDAPSSAPEDDGGRHRLVE